MILLLGGTADTDPIARALVSRGQKVLVSTATDYPLALPPHRNVERRVGALDEETLRHLITRRGISALVDATHPYAEIIGPMSFAIARDLAIPYFRFLRPQTRMIAKAAQVANNHEEAARIAFSFEKPVLLTVGSKNIGIYIETARRKSLPVYMRVLNRKASIDACYAQGVSPEAIVAAKGPFTALENIALIRRFEIGVLVTKDSGAAGGMPEKVDAAKETQCSLVVINRPRRKEIDGYSDLESMLSVLFKTLENAVSCRQ